MLIYYNYKMESVLKKLILDNRVDGRLSTHQSMGIVKGNYYFHRQVMEEFFDLYAKSINKDNELIEMGIAESPKDLFYIPVLVDVDLKLIEEDAELIGEYIGDFYSNENIVDLIKIYQKTLDDIVDNIKDEHKICVVLEKDPYKVTKGQSNYIKHGFHLHFPYLFMNKTDQKNHLLPRVSNLVKDANIFFQIVEDSSSVLDSGYLNSPWLLYGSSKGSSMDPYKVTKIYDSDCSEITMEKAFRHYQIYDSQEQLIKIINPEKFLPRILSIIPYNRGPITIKQNIISPLKQKMKEDKKKEYPILEVAKALEVVKEILPMISDDRANDHNDWMSIGWALYNISHGSDDGLQYWMDFANKAEDPRGEPRCIFEWNNMSKKCYSYSIGTLKHYAKADSPDLYSKYIETLSDKYMEESLDGSHNDIAKMLKAEYGNEFICPSIESKCWYQYKENKWERIDSGVFLRQKISDELDKKYLKICTKFWKEIIDATENKDEGRKAMYNVKLKQVQVIRKQLKNNGWKNAVMSECMYEFFDPSFKDKLDMNPMIIGFQNGIYDLERNVFRKGRPEDFISKNMPIDYIEYSNDDEDVTELIGILEKTFPDKSILKYFLDITSDVFEGGNIRKKVYFWLGGGDNGKSILQLLMECMLGQYQIKFDTNLITGKRPGSGSSHAELARSGGGVRNATLDEPDNDEEINSGIMKKLSGDDKYWARDLFEKGKDTTEIQPMFKLTFICNKLPQIKGSNDKAIWTRVRVLPFESTFVRPGDKTIAVPISYEEQVKQKIFHMDLDLKKKIPKLAQPFAWYLLQHRLKVTSCNEPEKVLIATNMYRMKTDIYRHFIEECIIDDEGSKLNLINLHEAYKEWFRQSYPGHTVQNKPEVQNYFENIWGECEKGKKWTGHRLRIARDDMDINDNENNENIKFVFEDDDNNLPKM